MIPTYNQEAYIREAVTSALNQSYPHIEIVVSDDCSTDGTADVLRTFVDQPKVRCFHNDHRMGRVGNYRELLYNRVRGDFVLNLDGDDWLEDTEFIAKAVALIEKYPELTLVIGGRQSSDTWLSYGQEQNGMADAVRLPEIFPGTLFVLEYAYGTLQLSHGAALYHRSTALAIGFYRLDVIGSDSESLLRLMIGRAVGSLPGTALVWRKHTGNESRIRQDGSQLSNLEAVASVCDAVEAKGVLTHTEHANWRSQYFARRVWWVVVGMVKAGLVFGAIRFIWSVERKYPRTGVELISYGVNRVAASLIASDVPDDKVPFRHAAKYMAFNDAKN